LFAIPLLFLTTVFSGQLIVPCLSYGFSSGRPTLGTKRVAAIAVQFQDVPPSTTISDLRDRIFDEMNSYYQNISYEKMSITGAIVNTWILLPHNMSYYGNYNGTNDSPDGAQALIRDALASSEGRMNFSQFDYVLVVHAGENEATSGNLTDIWSYGFWDGLSAFTIEGKIFNQGAVVSEFDGLGGFCHEFGHIIGLPDLYNYNKNSSNGFIGNWDLMGYGLYNGVPPGSHPAQISSWGKIFLGWINGTQITNYKLGTTENLTIEPLETNSEGIKAINISIAPNLYYLIEARIDINLPDQGILVALINETRNSGGGIVEVVDTKNSSLGLSDATLHVGDCFEEKQHIFTVTVLRSDNSSSTVQISNRLIPHFTVAMPSEAEAYQDAKIEVRIVAYNGTPLQGLATNLLINGEKRESLVTDANGTVIYAVNFNLLSMGKKNVTVTIAGGEFFLNRQIDLTLDITFPIWLLVVTLAILILIIVAAIVLCIKSHLNSSFCGLSTTQEL
jgi:M6 family metalloprotease-like protein